jgi:hypothetical protein
MSVWLWMALVISSHSPVRAKEHHHADDCSPTVLLKEGWHQIRNSQAGQADDHGCHTPEQQWTSAKMVDLPHTDDRHAQFHQSNQRGTQGRKTIAAKDCIDAQVRQCQCGLIRCLVQCRQQYRQQKPTSYSTTPLADLLLAGRTSSRC